MIMPVALFTYIAVFVAGCATPPGAIAAKPVTDNRFAELDCSLLISERDKKVTILALLSDAQSERYRADAISVAFTGLTQSMINSPKEREGKIAELKGEVDALNMQVLQKQCSIGLGQ